MYIFGHLQQNCANLPFSLVIKEMDEIVAQQLLLSSSL